MSDIWFYPNFDLGEFRHTVARYVKLLIRARWKLDAGFLSDSDLKRWGLVNINEDKSTVWQLLDEAASTLALLNTQYIPRCGSGGVPVTDTELAVGRLIHSVAFLVQPMGGGPYHNQSLLEAAEVIQRGGTIDWAILADWSTLGAIRDELDLLPHPGQPGGKLIRSREVTAEFSSPPNLRWEEVTLVFLSNDSVRVSARGKHKTFMFSELGFADGRKGDRPDTRWRILHEFAKKHGRIAWDTDISKKDRNRLQAAIKDIRPRLKKLTGLQDDPFHGYRSRKGYETKFTIRDESYSNHDEREGPPAE